MKRIELMEEEFKMRAVATLVKENYVWCDEYHKCVEYEIEPDGTRTPVITWERDETDENIFRGIFRTPDEIIELCERICRQLIKEGREYVDYELIPGRIRRVGMRDLANDCAGWTLEEFNAREIPEEEKDDSLIKFV